MIEIIALAFHNGTVRYSQKTLQVAMNLTPPYPVAIKQSVKVEDM